MSDRYFINNEDLTSVANAIREKTNTTEKLEFPTKFISEIEKITGGEVTADLSNYYKKSETYSKSQIDSQFKDIAKENTEIKTNINNKADKTTADSIQQQVNNLVLGAVGDGNNAEVVQARTNSMGFTYATLRDKNFADEYCIKNSSYPILIRDYENGSIYSNGNLYDNTTRLRTKTFYTFPNIKLNITVKAGYRAYLYKYTYDNNVYNCLGNDMLTLGNTVDYVNEYTFNSDYYYKIVLGRYDNADINVNEFSNAIEFEDIKYFDSIQKKVENFGINVGNMLVNQSKKPIITWIDDDTILGSTKGISFVKSLADELGIKCTFACITSGTDGITGLNNSSLCNTLLSYQAEGFHICSHSDTHSNKWKVSSEIYNKADNEKDYINSIKLLQQKGFVDSNYFVAPFGQTNDDTKYFLKKWSCNCNVNAMVDAYYNDNFGNGRYVLNRTFIDANKHDLNYYKSMIDTALSNGSWLIFGTHSGMSVENGGWNYELVKSVFEYAISKNIEIMTLNQAFNERKLLYSISEMF